ncbi:flagellar FlbD family protein [Lignipirellula cremea]|uniref:Flagellar protein (FlbD) n=1 Tax=Lignipirellula cremea TaxID=2528010 RepID=A0A518E0H1_9BACT|nr:flagellar FlbD family protein [Lignipirellula cremea]QDU97592.1 Flagellar protein (FlbD) [Lignipirellula cremea]
MIVLTRLDGERFVLNADLIRYIESRPDTFITLTSGDRVIVANTMDEVVELAIRYQQTKHALPAPHFGVDARRSPLGGRGHDAFSSRE